MNQPRDGIRPPSARWPLLVALAVWGCIVTPGFPAEHATEEDHGKPGGHTELTEEKSPSHAGPDDALENEYLNKLKQSAKPKPKPAGKNFQHEIDTARQLRRNKDLDNAEKMLVTLLEEDPPVDIKRAALFELALVAQDQKNVTRAQQIFAHYIQLYPQDPTVPEVLLRQGLIYRQMGAYNMAIGKYYSVMNSALGLKLDQFDYYKRLVLQAQTEIAETYYLQSKYAEASDFLRRILKQKSVELNRAQVHFKLIRCLSGLGKHTEVIMEMNNFIQEYPDASELPELYYLCASSYKTLGRTREAHGEVMKLLKSQADTVKTNPENWIYWQQRAGNDIANQLYLEGDYLNALGIYNHLASLSDAPVWQVPIWYQIGLIYERLSQPAKATDRYVAIAGREKDIVADGSPPSVKTVLEMAKWRKEQIEWRERTDLEVQSLRLRALPASGTNTASIQP